MEENARDRDDNARAVLAEARHLLAQGGWCQHAEARDDAGRPCHPASSAARVWSSTGALYRAAGFDGSPEKRQLFQAAVALLDLGPPALWNDRADRTHAEILATFDAALSRANRPRTG